MAFGGLREDGAGAPMNEINMTPLVDVMLVLLIVFMVTAPLITQAIPVDLPTVAGRAAPEPPEQVALTLNGRGELFWDRIPIDDAELRRRLAEVAARQPQPELRLHADRDTRYQRLAEIMAMARAAGISGMGFVTRAGPEGER